MSRILLQVILMLGATLLIAVPAFSHCEIPCGIYDDEMRISLLREHVATIEKSMDKINNPADGKNSNQHIRWIMNKELHANEFQEIVSQYFLTQRIKADDKNYEEMLTHLHQMLVYAMKCKQTTDLQNAAKLKEHIDAFAKLYFASHD
ncbi:MAG: superoxide dismutase [Ni] [Desulfocapsaceae bacterium]|nr:superoxide dismutase [Ni] [Desulfocapsaceae bacterium]